MVKQIDEKSEKDTEGLGSTPSERVRWRRRVSALHRRVETVADIFRMSAGQFKALLQILGPDQRRQSINYMTSPTDQP